jgi:hypothetical protein
MPNLSVKGQKCYNFTPATMTQIIPYTIFLYSRHNECRLGKHSSVDVCHGFRNLVLVCFDETSKQLISEINSPIAAEPGKSERFDYEYQREGVSVLRFVLCNGREL